MTRSVIQIRLPPSEKQQLQHRAAQAGLSLSDFIRARIIESPVTPPPQTPASAAAKKALQNTLCHRCARIGKPSCQACLAQ